MGLSTGYKKVKGEVFYTISAEELVAGERFELYRRSENPEEILKTARNLEKGKIDCTIRRITYFKEVHNISESERDEEIDTHRLEAIIGGVEPHPTIELPEAGENYADIDDYYEDASD